MSTLATPVAMRATDRPHTRRLLPTTTSNSPRAIPDALQGLEPLFFHTREAAAIGNIDSGQIVQWNPAAERLLGWSATDAVGRPIASLISPAIVPLYRAASAIRAAGAPPEPSRPLDLMLPHAAGGQVHAELSLVPVAYPDAPDRFVLMLLHADADARDDKSQREALLELQSQVTAARQRLSALESGVAELARDVRRACSSARHALRRAETPQLGRLSVSTRVASRRLQKLARDVDVLSSHSAHDLNPERVNLVPLVSRVVSRLRDERPRFRFNTALPQGLTATLDPQLIEQVVEILLERAMAGSRNGCWIDVDLRRPFVGQARLEVRDFGQSLGSPERERLAAGGRDDRALALAHAIVERHGGTLAFEFPADGGVRAVVLLPTQLRCRS